MLWVLKRLSDRPQYDVNNGFVIRASSEDVARIMASKVRGDEGAETWTDPRLSTCDRLWPVGDDEIVMQDFNAR